MPKISYARLMLSWEMLNRSLAANVSEPLIEARRRDLEAALVEVKERQRRQDVLLGQAVQNTRLLREAVARGKEAEARLRAFLKGTYGRESAELIRFGLRPQRKRRRGGEPAEAATVEPQAAQPAAEEPAETPSSPAPAAPHRKPAAGARRRQEGARPKRSPKGRRGKKKVL